MRALGACPNFLTFGRWARPEEPVGPAQLLASEAGSFITGVVLVVDGGVLAEATTDHFLQAKLAVVPLRNLRRSP